jgi:hypothetical protein
MTRLQMKSVPGGGYTLSVGDHTFNIVLNTGKTEGAFGPVSFRDYHVYVDDLRVGDTFKTAAEAKDFLVPYVERAQEQERRDRQTAMFREFAEEKLFPAGVPKSVLAAMEKYTSTIVVVEEPKRNPGTKRTKVKSEDKAPEQETETTPEDVAATVRKAQPRRSRAKSTSGTKTRRRTTKVKSEETTPDVPEQVSAPEPEPEVTPEATAEINEPETASA